MKLYQKIKEKLLSAHWLVVNDPSKFVKEFIPPPYLEEHNKNLHEDNKFYLDSKEGLSILKKMSKEIQEANKFYLDFNNSNVAENLTQKEMQTVAQDIKIFLPYEKTFIQFEDVNLVHNLYLQEVYDLNPSSRNKSIYKIGKRFGLFLPQKKNTRVYSMFHSIHFKDNYPNKVFANKTILDPSVYVINPVGEYWQEKGKNTDFGWGVLKEFEKFHGGGYRIGADDSFFDDMEHNTLRVWFLLNLLLSYPALSSNKTVKGKTGVHMNGTHGYKSSHLLRRPTWEHKVLKLDLYGSGSGGHNGNGSPKAFHSVRGHLRRLAKGKVAFIKPHFRGSKQVGTVEKEYALQKKK